MKEFWQDLKQAIRTVPDFPIPGIQFRDITSLIENPLAFNKALVDLTSLSFKATKIIGIESRGFVLGSALAHEMCLPFVMVRKKGAKYPGKLLEESYELEYGTDTLTLQEGILGHTDRVIIADDLIATGGSLDATRKLIEQTGAKVLGATTLVWLKYLTNSVTWQDDVVSSYTNWGNDD